MGAEGATISVGGTISTRSYAYYVVGVLTLAYAVNVMDRSVLAVLNESIKHEFGISDKMLGLLGGPSFALFYSTLGLPIAALADRTSRRSVLAACAALWSGATALCGVAANFWYLVLGRIGTAVGEAGGTPPSHALISDYFPVRERGTALSLYALGVPLGAVLGNALGGWGNGHFGWRYTFILVGLPGLLVAALVRFTVREPKRGSSDGIPATAAAGETPSLWAALGYLLRRPSFRHMGIAAGLHSLVWYSGSTLNASFLQRSHGMTSGQAGFWLAIFSATAAIGTLLGGYLGDKLSIWRGDRRWYMWVPGYATLAMLPFQFSSYLAGSLWVVVPSFILMLILGSMFFGPSFALSQGLATLRTRAVATSLTLFVQTLIGLGIGPFLAGAISDYLHPTFGADSLRYGLVTVGVINAWAAVHYFWGSRTLRQDMELATTLP
jgi:predicted MFS family arabinose efflux permease